MAAEAEKVEPADSEQDEGEDVYEVERIIDMRVEEGEVLYRVRWKNYCSDDDTWEPEAHLEDCCEVLLTFKRTMAELKAKKEAEAKKSVLLPTKSDVFDADSESDGEKDPPNVAPMKKKKKTKVREEDEEEEEPLQKEKKKKKKEKRKEDVRPLPAPESDEEERAPTPPSPSKEKKTESKKRLVDSEEEENEPVPTKKHKKEKGKDAGKHKKEKVEEGKKKKGKKDRKIETSDDEAAAPLEDDQSEGPSESQVDNSAPTDAAKSAEKARLEDKFKQKKGKWEVKLQGIKDLIHDKKNKKTEATLKESSLQKLKSLTAKSKDEAAPHSDSSDSSTLHKKAKSKGQESAPVPPKVPSSSTSSSSSSSSVTAASSTKGKEEEVAKEEVLGQKDGAVSTNLFEKFLLNCEAKDRAPRRPAAHQPTPEKTIGKPTKLIGKIEKVSKSTKESPAQKPEGEKTEKSKQSESSRSGYGFSLDSDEREEESAAKSKPGEEQREKKEKTEEGQRPSWERRTSADDRRKKREDSEPRLFMACDDNQDIPDPAEGADRSDKGHATLSLGMDLNLDWMTLDDFQKHLNGEDEILSGPPLSPSELRDAVKSGDYMAVKLALNSKEDYNLDQEACTMGETRSFEAERSLIEERSSSDDLRLTSNLDSARIEEGTPQDLDCPVAGENLKSSPSSTSSEQMTFRGHENVEDDGRGVRIGSEFNSSGFNSATKQDDEEKEGQREAQEDETSKNMTGGLPSTISLNVDHANSPRTPERTLTMERDNNDAPTEHSSSEEANDSSDENEGGLEGQSDGTDQPLQESDIKDIAKVQLRRRRKTVERTLPTRSSSRTCKKVLEINPSKDTEEKKEPCKKHFCLYCQQAFTQIAKHLERKHGDETDVCHAIHFPRGSKVRQTLLDQIRNKGDYEHNCQVLKSGEGEIVTKKQVKNTNISVRDYLPCQHCFAFYRKTDLWRHERSCKARKGDQKPSDKSKKSSVHSAASRLLPMSEFLTGGCEEIIHIMHQDEVSRHIRNDPLICKYGNALSAKYEHDKSQFAYIAQKMRELGRFVVAVKELDTSIKFLHEVCMPSKFQLAVEGAKKVSGFDPSSSKFKTVSLVSKIGYSLKRAAEIAFGESRMTEDTDTESEVKKFIQLLDTKWSECFSRKALALSLKQEVKKVEVDKSTVTEDLIKLHRFITEEGDGARRELKESPSLSTWKKLSEATLADVCLFNRGRVGNIGRMFLQTYTRRKSRETFVLSADQIKRSTKLELDLGASFTRLELEGQYGRNMLVLLTERMVSSIELIIANREQAGVAKTNPYLFARTEGPSFIRGLDCIRRAAMECGVKNPEALLCSSLREQISSCWQLMSLSESELDQVAMLVGRSSEECYMLSNNALQLEEVSKQLLTMERTLPSSPPSTAKDGLDILFLRSCWNDQSSPTNSSETGQKAALKRRPWSEKEQAAVKRYLNEFITTMKVPGKKECNACIVAEPDLCGRSWTDVKNYVHNTLQTIRRRSRSDGNIHESPKARVQTPKTDLEDTSVVCTMTTVNPEHLTENCCMTMAPPTHLGDSVYSQDLTQSYASLCSTSTNLVHSSQPLISSFTPLNATDTQVVPTFTPHNTTNALMSPAYTSENNIIMPMSPSYTQNTTGMPPPSVYTQQDTNLPLIPSYTTLNAPSTSMGPTYTSLNTASAPMIPSFSALNDRGRPIVSSFTALNHPSTPAYLTNQSSTPTTAQVVPTIHRPNVPDGTPVAKDSTAKSTAGKRVTPADKSQKRIKRLWSEEEQGAVRRQFGDFCKLVKVPGKKDCDACLAAEPALNTRTWREVKYFVHNSIQSMKRRGLPVAAKQSVGPEPETQNPNPEWDGPVYLSL
ncbi:M-phase phosphoprotein 8 isoform X2 [Notolabrus celidotus]|uniref:M-phase phosphoprotein 8 isoform X2 n=1 Tax=Notolabrus celidotus TaxID=1203425 RepID=UPI00148F4EBE|nr:M-phase phosphoprotein 8 isoform X2 [Notolabrus celidotus]